MIVADTDVLIDFFRNSEPVATRVDLEIRTGRLATTTVTEFELRSGIRSERQLRDVDSLLASMSVLPLGSPEAAVAAQLRVQLESKGQGIGTADYLIAGICLARRAILMTRNLEHFQRVPGLAIASLEGTAPTSR